MASWLTQLFILLKLIIWVPVILGDMGYKYVLYFSLHYRPSFLTQFQTAGMKYYKKVFFNKSSVVPRDYLDIQVHISTAYLVELKWTTIWLGTLPESFSEFLGYLDWLKMHFPAWSNVFTPSCFKKFEFNIWAPVLIQQSRK